MAALSGALCSQNVCSFAMIAARGTKKMCDRLREQDAIPKEEDAGLGNPATTAVQTSSE